ncbi:hypothetical protein PS9374_07124 [Planomonospora sphaerica]|uniref:Uncharacterized protein n=1 Tax=Planomonospora sphaerica TaxID=161355 RepID=A0A161MFV3_9ACTN|nr:transposase [Planomonospora sphaerica]GAT71433.1 hypothetical protein PS9374_07124 [Planomonospora sphaerica]
MGRRSKLTPGIHERIVQALQGGNSFATAARLAGISPRTLHAWRQRGEADDASEEFAAFAQAVELARATVCEQLVDAALRDAVGGTLVAETIRPGGFVSHRWTPPNGHIALAMLARMDPEAWAPVKPREHAPVNTVEPVDDLAALQSAADKVAARLAETRAARERGGLHLVAG